MSIIKPINSCRGIFALCIVCFHFGHHEFHEMTLLGISFFLMVSGFLVGLKQDEITQVARYYRNRLWRIFSLVWLSLACLVVIDLVMMHKFNYSWQFPVHVLLLQSWFPSESVYYNFNPHAWFMSTLLAATIFTPWLLRWMSRGSLKVAWTVLAVACVAVTALECCASETVRDYTYVCPLTRLVDYSLGMALGITLRRLNTREKLKNISLANASLLELAAIAVVAAFIAWHASGDIASLKLENAPLWWIPALLFLTTSYSLSGHEGLLGKLLSIKPLVWLGTISFEMYILQKVVNNAFCYVIAPFFGHYGIMIYDYSFVTHIPMLIVLAAAVHYWYTKPMLRLASGAKK